ncbi:ras GTPase-activating protein 4-like isoform X2 [Dendronephthya gigantea]|uniref:ras GTPase-activating protein 4-like isoform X2 n=1 Tax=Dendronephthya gigantea TaxID=151771 RepID=UPI001069B887|nr:ras GTPase-activating protein 4-like isoform X2 [Dendronephthya gigantea]
MSNFLTTLDLIVSECKGLPAKDILGRSDPYCLIKVDNHVIARTATVWNCLEPFWGEEYSFSLSSHHLQTLSVYVYDEDAHFDDDVIGKVTFSRDDMLSMNPAGGEVWYSLRQVDNASEVHGQLHLNILATKHSEQQTNISVKVLEARNLGMKQKYVSDPFVRISLRPKEEGSNYHTRRKSEGASVRGQKRTSVRKTSCPIWNSSFQLICTTPLHEQYICAEVYDKERIVQNFLIGEVLVDLDSITVGEQVDNWYTLTPRESGKIKTDVKKKDLGKIRLNVQFFEEDILPWDCYIPFINLLVETVKKQPYEQVNTLSLLEQVMTADRTAIGRALVKLYLHQGMIVKCLDALTMFEVVNTETLNTLFRGNSLATKAVDEFMKVIGIPYLLDTLKPIIDKIYKEKRYCEIDPNKIDRTIPRRLSIFQMDDSSIQVKSVAYLKSYLTSILNSILQSTERCPYVMKQVFCNLYNTAVQRFTDNEESGKYLAVSSFLFLRFFVPAVLSPKLFGVAEHHPEQVVSRTLTLLAKVLQSIGNFNPGIVKEPWMLPFSDFIKEYALKLKNFIDELVSIPLNNHNLIENDDSNCDTPLLIKEGQMKKCKMGGKLANVQWKKYNFTLFNDSIHYSKKYDSQTRKFLLASRIIAVEKVEDSVFGKSNVFQIIMDYPSDDGSRDIHYLLAKDVKEMNHWISAIRRILPSDVGGPREKCKRYHRGIFNGQFWNCCKHRLQKDPGCSLTHSMASLNDWQDPVFPEQQAQIIYKQFLLGRERLKDLLVEELREHNELLDLSKDEILNRISEENMRVNSDSGCDTDNDEDKLLTCDFHMTSTSRTIMNILSIVNMLETKQREYSLGRHGNMERGESFESEDEVFSCPLTPSSDSQVQESLSELELTDTSVSQ